MDRNEKIAAALTAVVSVGSVALFATARIKARNYIWNTQIEKRDTIRVVATVGNPLSA